MITVHIGQPWVDGLASEFGLEVGAFLFGMNQIPHEMREP